MRLQTSLALISLLGCRSAAGEFEGVPESQKAIMRGTHEVCRGVRPSAGNEERNGHILTIPPGETTTTWAQKVCAVVSDRSIVFIDSQRAFLLGTGIDAEHLARISDGRNGPYFWCRAAKPDGAGDRRVRNFDVTYSVALDEALTRACLEFSGPSFVETHRGYGKQWRIRTLSTLAEYQRLCELMPSAKAGVSCREELPEN